MYNFSIGIAHIKEILTEKGQVNEKNNSYLDFWGYAFVGL